MGEQRAPYEAIRSLLGRAQPSHGFELALVGRSPAGREHVGVQWEVKPLGTPFTGLGLGSAPLPYDTGAPGSDGSRVDVREDVLGLLAFHRYHWRARLVSRNPFFPRSPWLSAAGNGQTELKLRTPLEGAGSGRTGPKRRTDPM